MKSREIAVFSAIAILAGLGIWYFSRIPKGGSVDNFEFSSGMKGCGAGTKCLCRPFCVKSVEGTPYESLGCRYYRDKGQWEYVTVRDPQFVGV